MRKILIGLVALTIFVAPLSALAAIDAPQDSCTLKRDITVNIGGGFNTTFKKGIVVAESGQPSACSVAQSANVDVTTSCNTPNWGMVCIINTLNSIIDWVFTILVILAVGFTLAGAWTILTAGGKAENVTIGKNFILYAAIGLAVAFLARALPGIVRSIAGF